ncbi:hypothetical protein [Alicyclobacillus acidiphilus]|uniref:hypothetical protein n=1 Tax=Alicyclobacillus acidiphilus TaxID=182455 RepID=UPI00082CA98F|nr:hypothetical protein [Alicyclobacillus acidiphilus]
MVMPRKPDPEKRSRQLNIYLQPKVYEAFQRLAEQNNESMSSMAAQLIEDRVFNAKNEDQRIVVHPDVVMAVVRQVIQEGFEISDKFAPKSKWPQDEDSPKYAYPQPSVDNPVDSDVDKSSANLSPKTSPATSTGAKAKEQREDEGGNIVAPKTKR